MNHLPRRVVITGMGVVSALGHNSKTLFKNLLAGKSAVRFMEEWEQKVPAAPITDFVLPSELHTRVFTRTMGKVGQYCASAAFSAWKDSGLPAFPDGGRSVCCAGSTFGSSGVLEETFRTLLLGKGMDDVSPMNFFKTVSHTAAYNTANILGLDGPVYAPSAACASSLQAIGLASTLIASGEADCAVAGGGDELSHLVAESFILMDAHARCSKENASEHPRPFDRNRSGLVCGEGAAMVVLEEYGSARKRGANIIAEILGYAANRGKNTVTQSESKAICACLELLKEKCSFPGNKKFAVNAHATGTLQGDMAEAEALYKCFGNTVPVSSFKGNIGHSLGASGAMELVAGLEMMHNNIILPTRNLEEAAKEYSNLDLPLHAREYKYDMLLKNSFAFGGLNAAILCCKI